MCENLEGVYSSDADGKQLYEEILDSKMPVSSRATQNLQLLCKKYRRRQYILCKLRAIFQ